MPLSWQLYCVWCSLAGLGILVALGFLAFNIKYRNVRWALRDSRLFLTVAVLVGINLLVLLVWTAVDPMTVVREDLDESETSRGGDMTTVYQAQLCHSEYMVHFSVGLLALQALLVAFGAFLAWQTRNMTIPELNDSRWVGLCIYSVVVLGLLGAIHVLVGRPTPDTSYILSSALVFAGTTLTQCLVFVPKEPQTSTLL
nr:hypothetical protein BaRGS_018781 [Batillaria attramentaria]